jgi:DNA-binding response OmpR family regulator
LLHSILEQGLMARVLLVEDELTLGVTLQEGLERAQHTVDLARDGDEALDYARVAAYDAIVLDVMLPKRNGLDVCRQLRTDGVRSPILMLTARDAVDDRIRGLDSGADDYLVKPFAFGELLARIRALLRRDAPSREATVRVSDLTLDPAAQRIEWQGRPLDLTAREYRILDVLMRRPNWIVSRESLIESVWGYDFTDTSNLVEVYVGRIRRKLAEAGAPALIQTVRGAGYRLRSEPVS